MVIGDQIKVKISLSLSIAGVDAIRQLVDLVFETLLEGGGCMKIDSRQLSRGREARGGRGVAAS